MPSGFVRLRMPAAKAATCGFAARPSGCSSLNVVPLAGIEPARPLRQQILSLPRLPVPHRGNRVAIASGAIIARAAGRQLPPAGGNRR